MRSLQSQIPAEAVGRPRRPLTLTWEDDFAGHPNPRPQTIGLFISHSGVNNGARSVARRAANSKTVVIFELPEIEKIMLEFANPGPIFDEKLRDAYDYIFESTEDN
jgi:hypothetical protein